ncbi:hypothetical protein AAG570_011541 [Ranatra chinensis]|uniref:Uncharacterized protein n=1 Tax=Ranatra chinensis TaxID=642074 RepID=A0ABD0YKY4_9HEMI
METGPIWNVLVSLVFLMAPIVWTAHGSNADSTGEDMGGGIGAEDIGAMAKDKFGGGSSGLWRQLVEQRRPPDYEEEKQDEPFVELFKQAPWALIQLKGKRQSFTPRLGRDTQDEEMGFSKTSRSPPFAPRLGRRQKATVLPFSPRIGRIVDSDILSERGTAKGLVPPSSGRFYCKTVFARSDPLGAGAPPEDITSPPSQSIPKLLRKDLQVVP